MSLLKRLLKQYKIPWIGGFKDILGQLVFYVSMVNFILIVVTAYNTTLREYFVKWIPGFQLWMFFAVLIFMILGMMVIEYKFIVPSLYAFRSKQLFEHESAVMDELAEIRKAISKDVPSESQIVVAVAGGFDPLNGRGHLSHITEAGKLGDRLVVILSRDDQLVAKGNKPNGTFYPDISDRIAIIQELQSVDEVVVNIDEDGTCAETLRLTRPNIFAKGGDRVPGNMPECEIKVCEEIGCEIVYEVGDPKFKTASSSELLRRSSDVVR